MANIIPQAISDKETWEKFNLGLPNASYFQSWQWGDVQQKSGTDIERVGFFDKNNIIGIAQLLDIRARRGHYIHIRQGPVFKHWDSYVASSFTTYIKEYAGKKSASFVRINPLIPPIDSTISQLKKLGYKTSPVHNQDAENRWVLNITPPEDELLKAMRKTTRYMIKKGENLNIKIIRSQNISDYGIFKKLYDETAKLKSFITHKNIEEELNIWMKEGKGFLYFAYEGEIPIASAIIVYYADEAIYRHGATSTGGRRSPASYVLQWRAISDAKKAGLSTYNFWGIAPDEDNIKHPWYGLTLFKMGFGGERVDFIHSMDLPLRSSYWLTYGYDLLTSFRKGYL